MVNFSSEDSLKIPISDIKKRLILEKRETVNQMITVSHADSDFSPEEKNKVRAQIISLFMELSEHIRRFYPEKFAPIKRLCYSQDAKDLNTAFEDLEFIMYEIVEVNKEVLL